MRSKVGAGILAGLAAGVVFGIMMQLMTVPAEGGMRMPMMAMVARVVRSDSILVGWLYHLFNSAAIGALFAVVLGIRARSYGSGAGWGLIYGGAWWILGAQILMPLFLRMPAFASLRMPPMRGMALGSLAGHLVYGLVLGIGFVKLRQPSTGTRAS